MDSVRTNFAFHHFVGDPNIGKGASSHNKIVSSSSTIRVEIFLLNIPFFQETSSRRRHGNISSRRNVISSDGISE